jgi:hypothetical protein
MFAAHFAYGEGAPLQRRRRVRGDHLMLRSTDKLTRRLLLHQGLSLTAVHLDCLVLAGGLEQHFNEKPT